MVNTEHDFMVELSVGLGSFHDRHDLTWTVEQAKQQFLDVTVPNAYQAVLARAEEAGR